MGAVTGSISDEQQLSGQRTFSSRQELAAAVTGATTPRPQCHETLDEKGLGNRDHARSAAIQCLIAMRAEL